MPFLQGYKVCKKDDMRKCFSKKFLTYNQALSQMRAIIINEKKYSRIL